VDGDDEFALDVACQGTAGAGLARPEGHTYSSEAGYTPQVELSIGSLRLDALRVPLLMPPHPAGHSRRVRFRNPEGELLLLRHKLRVLRRQINT